MSEPIYVVQRSSGSVQKLERQSFSDLRIAERADLEAWVARLPDILGEPLLTISTEYSGFTQSARRIDLLALDAKGHLVVVELKLDAERTHADLQAIRYAAMCSTMTVEQALDAYADHHGVDRAQAEQGFLAFLQSEALPESLGEPRIILAAGSMDDQELTTSVLWLRRKGLDITCVELTPYARGTDEITIVPKVVIPLPEARDYLVAIENRDRTADLQRRQSENLAALWRAIAIHFKDLVIPGVEASPSTGFGSRWWSIRLGIKDVHYEFNYHKSGPIMQVALHFEAPDIAVNRRRLAAAVPHPAAVQQGCSEDYFCGDWGDHWTSVGFNLPIGDLSQEEVVRRSVERMRLLIARTGPQMAAVRQIAG